MFVIKLLGKENLADIRISDLSNKRTLQFDEVLCSSDNRVFYIGCRPGIARNTLVDLNGSSYSSKPVHIYRPENEKTLALAVICHL